MLILPVVPDAQSDQSPVYGLEQQFTRGSFMSALVLLIILSELKKIEHLISFRNVFNKFNNIQMHGGGGGYGIGREATD